MQVNEVGMAEKACQACCQNIFGRFAKDLGIVGMQLHVESM